METNEKNFMEININPKETTEKIAQFLKEEFAKRQKKTAVLGISGGVDSAVSLFLCQKAGLDVFALSLPCGGRGIEGKDLIETCRTIDIGPIVDKISQELGDLDKQSKGNIAARIRMVIQYNFAKKLNGLVIGTENLSEYYLGYFTLFGDQACDISPIAGLLKKQVYQLAEYLKVPNWVIEKAPTAGLWDGQTDEGELGFTYEDADKVIFWHLINKCLFEEIEEKSGIPKEISNKILKRISETEYKRQKQPKFELWK